MSLGHAPGSLPPVWRVNRQTTTDLTRPTHTALASRGSSLAGALHRSTAHYTASRQLNEHCCISGRHATNHTNCLLAVVLFDIRHSVSAMIAAEPRRPAGLMPPAEAYVTTSESSIAPSTNIICLPWHECGRNCANTAADACADGAPRVRACVRACVFVC